MFKDSGSNRTFGAVSAALLLVLTITVALRAKPASAQNDNGQKGELHLIKDCSEYNNNAGDYCTIVTSNLSAIPPGSRVFYTQAPLGPNPNDPFATEYLDISLDSNVVLHVATGNWAIGRCTLNADGATGICTFSDGTGTLAGFSARIEVSYPGGSNYSWDGTYSFAPKGAK